MSRHKVIVAFGGNQGPTREIFSSAKSMLESSIGPCILVSRVYRSIPMTTHGPACERAPFLNAAASYSTSLPPLEVLECCLAVERLLGRKRELEKKWESRSIDLDVIAYDDVITASDGLVLPHPELSRRDFVLLPLRDIEPHFVHPADGRTIDGMLSELTERYVTHEECSSF